MKHRPAILISKSFYPELSRRSDPLPEEPDPPLELPPDFEDSDPTGDESSPAECHVSTSRQSPTLLRSLESNQEPVRTLSSAWEASAKPVVFSE